MWSRTARWHRYFSNLWENTWRIMLIAAPLLLVVAAAMSWRLMDVDKALHLSFAELLVLVVVYFVAALWVRERRVTRIFPFRNLTGDEKNKAKYDALAAGFTEVMNRELQRINRLQTIGSLMSEGGVVPHSLKDLSSLQRPGAPSGRPFARIGVDSGIQLGDALTNVGAVSIGGVNLPLGNLLNLIVRFFEGGGISGSFHKRGEALSIMVDFSGPPAGTWEVRSDSLPSENQSEEQIIDEMARRLVYMMIWDVTDNTANDWRSFRELFEGLEHYWHYVQSGRSDQQSLHKARQRLERAVALDPRFAPTYHNLGLLYDEMQMTESAMEMYKIALQFESTLLEPHLRLGQAYYTKRGDVKAAIRECELAVNLADRAHRNYPSARSFLGYLLAEDARAEKSQGDRWSLMASSQTPGKGEPAKLKQSAVQQYQKAAERFWEGIAYDEEAVKGYEKLLRRTRTTPNAASGPLPQLREELRQVGANLGSVHQALGEIRMALQTAGADTRRIEQFAKRARTQTEHVFDTCLDLQPDDSLVYVARGRYYAGQQDYDLALRLFERALELDVSNVEAARGIGDCQLEFARQKGNATSSRKVEGADQDLALFADRMNKAVEMYERVLASDPHDFEAWLSLAEVAYWRGVVGMPLDPVLNTQAQPQLDLQRAVALFGEALMLDPFEPRVYVFLNRVHQKLSALAQPNTPPPEEPAPRSRARRARGALFTAKSAPGAIPSAIVPIGPYERLAQLMSQTFDPRVADPVRTIDQWLTAGTETTADVRARLVYSWVQGWLLAQSGQAAEAVKCVTQVITEADPTDFWEATLAYYHIGMLYSQLGQWEQAVEALLRTDVQTSWLPEPKGQRVQRLRDLANAYTLWGKFTEATKYYQQILAEGADDPYQRAEILVTCANLYLTDNRPAEAIQNSEDAIQLAPLYAYAYAILADAYFALLDYDRATEAWRKADELVPNQPLWFAHEGLGRIYEAQAAAATVPETLLGKAIDEYRQAIALLQSDPASDVSRLAALHASLAGALAALDRHKEASLGYERALQLAKDAAGAHEYHLSLADECVKLNQFSRAEAEYREAIRLAERDKTKAEDDKRPDEIEHCNQNLARAYNQIAYHLCAEQDVHLDDGLKSVEQALVLTPESLKDSRAAYLDTRGWLYFKQSNYVKAKDDFEQALSLDQGSIEGRYHLAFNYERLAEASAIPSEREQLARLAQLNWEHMFNLDPQGSWGKIASEHLQKENVNPAKVSQ